jgi:hypothetical protein
MMLRSFLDDCANEHKLIKGEVKGGLLAGADVSGPGSSTIGYHEGGEDIGLEKRIGSLYLVQIGGSGRAGAGRRGLGNLSTHRAFHFEVDQPPQGGGVFDGKLPHEVIDESVDGEAHGLLFRQPALAQVEDLLFVDL